MKRLAKFAMIAVLIWTFPLTLYAAPVGKFTMVRGTVDITSPEGGSQIVGVGFSVNVGDVVRTKSRSSAEILFEDGSVMRLARNSRIAIDEYAMGREQDRGIFKLFRGKVQSIVEKAAGLFAKKRARFEIHTPTAVAGVRGTNFFTWYNQGVSGVAVREGTVYNYAANNPNQVREVNAGQSSIVVSADESPVVGTATDAELTLDEEEEGSPSAFLGEADEDPFVPAEEPGTLVTKDNTEEIVPGVSGTATPDFELQLAGGFLTGTLAGGNGALTLSSTFNSATAANTMSASGDLSNGGSLAGYLGGVQGSWEGLFNSIYANPDGGAGFIYGTLSGDVTESQLSATGPMTKTSALGTVADPASDLALEPLYLPAAIIGTPDADPMVAGLLTANVAGGADRWLGIFSLASTDTGYTPLAASAYYGLAISGTYSGVDANNNPTDVPYLLAGYVNIADDQAGHIQVDDQGNLFYIDPLHHGTYDVSYRGAYDAGGNLSLAGSGMFVLDPLDYSGFWGGDGTVFYNDNGYAGVAATDFGLMGLVASAAGYDFYAAGDYFLTGAATETDPFVWGTAIGGEDGTGSGDLLGGWTAGNWQYTTNSYGLPGSLDGAMTALKTNAAGGLVTVEQISGDLIGEYFAAPLGYEESDGLFRVRDDGGLTVASFTAAEGDLELISGSFSLSLAGDLGTSGGIQGSGGGYLTAFMDTATGQGLGTFALGLEGGGPGPASLSLGYGGNAYTGRGDGDQNFSAKAGGEVQYGADSWTGIGATAATGGTGFYLANVAGTLAGDGSMTASLAGTLMTRTFIADMNGSVFGQGADGEISGDGTWIGQGVGTLDNVDALGFASSFDYGGYASGTGAMPAAIFHARKYYQAQYANPSDSGDYYSYEHYSDNSYGYAYRRSPDGLGGYDYTYTYYYGNGSTETYDSATGQYTYGTWDPETFVLSQLENVPAGLTYENYAYDYLQTGTGGALSGILGGTDDIWSSTDVEVTSLGNYTGGHGDKGVWGTQVWSWNVLDDTPTTLSGSGSGGAYSGFFGGRLVDDALDGSLVSLYLDPDGNLGFLQGDLSGMVYPDLAMFAMDGTLNRLEIVNGFGGLPETFEPDLGSLSFSAASGGLADTGTIQGNGGTGTTATMGWLESELEALSAGLPENPRMAGVWMRFLYGGYAYAGTFDSDTTWDLYTEGGWGSGDYQMVVDGDKWTGGKAEGRVAGAWVDLDNYITGALGGQLKGTFDADHATWEAVTSGAMLDTETFLAMAGTDAGRSALQAMNIPGFEVGRVDLHGTDATYGDLTVNMWNTTFFAHESAANAPRIWASGAVTGTNPNARSYINVPVSGGGVSADFNMQNYSAGGNWSAAVNNGVGTVGSYSVAFQGGAAGQAQGGTDPYNGGAAVDFSGTASGVVTSASAVTPP